MGYSHGKRTSVSQRKLDQLEFDSLPPALRRKYFSSLERLRLAQDVSFSTRVSEQELSLRRQKSQPKSSSRNAQFRFDQQPTYLAKSSSRRLRKTQSTSASYLASQADTEWYLSLPSKIQQSHFSREEQIILAGTLDTVILDAADETLVRLSQQDGTTVEILRSETLSQDDEMQEAPRMAEGNNPETSGLSVEDGMFSNFYWGEERDRLDLSLDEYHAAIAATVDSTPSPGKGRPSFRRHLSMTSIQFQRSPPSASQKPSHSNQSSPTPPYLVPTNSRPASTLLAPLHKAHASLSSIDPTAKHYRDPEARLKLRVYLASPQKFDEALEFGFPSIENKDRLVYGRPATSPRLKEDSERTFFNDDSGSLFGDTHGVRDEDTSVTDSDSPRTPQDVVFEDFRSSEHNRSDNSFNSRSVFLRNLSEPYGHASPAKREMTLHMTLTRPDLRTVDSAPTPTPVDERIAVETMPSFQEQLAIWDASPLEESRMKKLWKRLVK